MSGRTGVRREQLVASMARVRRAFVELHRALAEHSQLLSGTEPEQPGAWVEHPRADPRVRGTRGAQRMTAITTVPYLPDGKHWAACEIIGDIPDAEWQRIGSLLRAELKKPRSPGETPMHRVITPKHVVEQLHLYRRGEVPGPLKPLAETRPKAAQEWRPPDWQKDHDDELQPIAAAAASALAQLRKRVKPT